MEKPPAGMIEDPLYEYKLELLKTHEKSQDSFETQLSYISAGALSLSMIFIDKVVKNIFQAQYKWLLVCSWVLLGFTLVVNLLSHLIAARSAYKTIDDLEKNRFDPERSELRNKKIDAINTSTIISLTLGILFLIVFVTINTMGHQNEASPGLQTEQTSSPAITPVKPVESLKK